ncbi:hypothetical protein BYT27DRAFT_7224925 [Phlegmacium glaucopus]|nr:hypothetical protein BYT27DRAFT_7224925 [Phlegmacium glaucopus]
MSDEDVIIERMILLTRNAIQGCFQNSIGARQRQELLLNPHIGTPWQTLWASQEDRAFITTMGLDVVTFYRILEGPRGFEEWWESTPIPRNDVSCSGDPRGYRQSLDAAGGLGLILHYLGSAMLEVTLQQVFALTPTVLSRYLEFAEDILYNTLHSLEEGSISMPHTAQEFQHFSNLICMRHPLLEGAFGSIDGLSLLAQESDDPEIENATYNGWKTAHCINNVLVFSPEGVIISAVINAPGSWHDAHVACPIFEQLRSHVPDGHFLGERILAEYAAQQLTLAVNRQLLSYRQTAKWGIRMIQGSFGHLRVPLKISSPKRRQRLLEIIIRLANIQTVYMPIWKAAEDEQLWLDLGDMMFGDIWRRDCVSRFHLVVEDQ